MASIFERKTKNVVTSDYLNEWIDDDLILHGNGKIVNQSQKTTSKGIDIL